MADLDRGFVSQYSQEDVGLGIVISGVPTDPDGNAVSVTVVNEDTQAVLLTRVATRVDVGNYKITLTPDDTAALGNYQATWSYELSGTQRTFNAYFSVGGAEPAYDALTDDFKAVVDQVWVLFADLFDSPNGGPFLQTRPMSNFNRGRIAQLMLRALGLLNTQAQPYQSYTLSGVGGTAFPMAQWGPLLVQATYIQVLKHLQRSYLEQPEFMGASISRLDRQQYFQRWGAILEEEQADFRDQLSIFKMSAMGLGRAPSVLVSGGAFGRYSSLNRPFMSARPRLWFANSW